MDENVTVSVKGLLVAGLVALTLVAAYLLGSTDGGAGPAQAASPAQAAPRAASSADGKRTFTTTGVGTVTAVPDQLTFSMQIGVTRRNLEDALDGANGVMRDALKSLTAQGVDGSDTRTTSLNMNPVYRYEDDEPPELTGYHVTETAQVTVDELAQGGKAVTAVVDAGGNAVRVSDIRLEVGDPEKVMGEARTSAVEEAKQKAEEYAAATGQTLGDVVTLHEVAPASGSRYDEPSRDYAFADSASAASPVPIRAGEDELAVTVEVVWALS